MKLVKYKLAAFFAYHTNQTLPTCPFDPLLDRPEQLFGSALGRFIQVFFKRTDRLTKMSFLSSIKQAKKGMPRPDDSILEESTEEAVKKLTNPAASQEVGGPEDWLVNWADVEENQSMETSFVLSRETFKKQLQRTVNEVFKNEQLTTPDRVTAFFPSTSANYINSRLNAGAIGAILEHPTLLKGLRKEGGYLRAQAQQEEESMKSEDWINVPGNDADFNTAFSTLWIRLLGEASREENLAEPVALAESLKVRIITKGPPFIQTVLRCVQKKMHSVMRRTKGFQLIGTPVTEKIILDAFGDKLKEDEAYLSGDYEDATNNIHSWVTEDTAEAVATALKLYPVERRLLLDALIHHKIRGNPQTQGQLMGSIVSFVILCLIVMTIARWALEAGTLRKWTLKDAPILNNGDDLAMKGTSKVKDIWEKISAYAGLKSSVGKTYFSRDFVEINSTQFLRTEAKPFVDIKIITKWKKYPHGNFPVHTKQYIRRLNPFTQTPFVNMGLLTGRKRSGARSYGLIDPDKPTTQIGVRYRELIRTAPPSMKLQLHKMFIRMNKIHLDKANPIPWYVPSWIGGLGLTGVEEPSVLDRRLAQKIILDWSKRRPIDLSQVDAPWRVWKLAESEVPEPLLTSIKNDGVEYYTKIVASKCIDLLFDSTIDLYTLMPGTHSRISNQLANNKKFWRPPKGALPQPIDADRLTFRSVWSTYQREAVPSALIHTLD
jgi:hypothetical protein